MGCFAVIDTETNWENEVMSVGVVLADASDFALLDSRYYILTPEVTVGGMFEDQLEIVPRKRTVLCRREKAMEALESWLEQAGVERIFAYNACFDRRQLPELGAYGWYDIMKVAAYRQHNPAIPAEAPCCTTGRLRSGYGVEPMLRLLLGDRSYRETHNALFDAVDELQIMKLLRRPVNQYGCAKI